MCTLNRVFPCKFSFCSKKEDVSKQAKQIELKIKMAVVMLEPCDSYSIVDFYILPSIWFHCLINALLLNL